MEYLITRIGFCDRCCKAKRPKSSDEFIAFGSTSKRFLEMEADHMGLSGFVPHIYKLFTKDGKIWYQRVCAMNNCGVEYYIDKNGEKRWNMKQERWSVPKVISVSELRALKKFTDTGYKI